MACCFKFFKGKDKTRKGSSSSDSSPETTRKPQNLKEFIDDAVKTHNDLRKKHGVPSVKHSKDLSDYAQKWAEHLAATGSFGHSSCQLKSDRLGENIACRSGTGNVDYSGEQLLSIQTNYLTHVFINVTYLYSNFKSIH